MTIEINKVVFYGAYGDRKLGLADYRVANEGAITQVRITDTYKAGKNIGKLIYPTLLCMPTSEVIKYPTKVVGKSHRVTVYLIPLRDFKHPKFDLKDEAYYEAIKESEKPKKVEEKPEIQQGVFNL